MNGMMDVMKFFFFKEPLCCYVEEKEHKVGGGKWRGFSLRGDGDDDDDDDDEKWKMASIAILSFVLK